MLHQHRAGLTVTMQRSVQRQVNEYLPPVFMPYVIKCDTSFSNLLKSKGLLEFRCHILVSLTCLQISGLVFVALDSFYLWDRCLTKVKETWTIQLYNGEANAFPEIIEWGQGRVRAVSWASIAAAIADLLVFLPLASWDIQLIRLNLFPFVSTHPGLVVQRVCMKDWSLCQCKHMNSFIQKTSLTAWKTKMSSHNS